MKKNLINKIETGVLYLLAAATATFIFAGYFLGYERGEDFLRDLIATFSRL